MQSITLLNGRELCPPLPSCSHSIVHRTSRGFTSPCQERRAVLCFHSPVKFTSRRSNIRHGRRPFAATGGYNGGWDNEERQLRQRLKELSQQQAARMGNLRRMQEERRRGLEQQQRRMMDALNVRREGMDWRALVLPVLGVAWLTFFVGPLIIGLLMAGLAIGAAVTFSAASMFLLLPLFGGALLLGGVGFGLSAGAFLLPGLIFSAFNLLVVGGGLAAGFALTNALLRGGSSGSKKAAGSGRAAGRASSAAQAEVDVEAAVRDAEAGEAGEAARAAEEELRRFDSLLEQRARERQIEQGKRWKP